MPQPTLFKVPSAARAQELSVANSRTCPHTVSPVPCAACRAARLDCRTEGCERVRSRVNAQCGPCDPQRGHIECTFALTLSSRPVGATVVGVHRHRPH
eukprot:1513026-Pleurochrysis_carterae.AAC.1